MAKAKQMASESELTVSIAVDHRIRGLAMVGLTFLKMAIQELFTGNLNQKRI